MKKKILVVDDEEDILHFLELVLREKGYEVATASSGHEALTRAQMVRPDGDIAQSANTMVMGFYQPATDPAIAAEHAGFLDFIQSVLADEDYAMGFDIQRGLKSGAQSAVTLGLNEPGVIYFHETMRDLLAEAGAP